MASTCHIVFFLFFVFVFVFFLNYILCHCNPVVLCDMETSKIQLNWQKKKKKDSEFPSVTHNKWDLKYIL